MRSTKKEVKLTSTQKSAQKAKKKAKKAYKAIQKELKARLKPYKQALKEAEKAAKLAKAAINAAASMEQNGMSSAAVAADASAPKKRGRKPGFSPKAAKAAKAPKAKPGKKLKATKTTGGSSDLTLVKGVGENIAVMLMENGIKSFADMAATSFDRYKELLKANGMSKFRDPSQWAARAAELANMPAESEPAEPKKRGRKPGLSPKAAKTAKAPAASKGKPGRKPAAASAKATTSKGGDDLTQVKGVGENIAEMLKANGVKTFANMAATSFDRYKELLKANGMSKFRDPSQWAARAAELANLPAPPAVESKAAEPAEPAEPKKRGRKPGSSPKATKAATAPKGKPGRKPGTAKAAAAPKATTSSGGDDLTRVKGVGDNIAVMLIANGVASFTDMAATSFDRYKELLKANGMSKFRDPSQWAARAAELVGEPVAAPKKRGRQPGFSPKTSKAAKAPAAPKGKPERKPAAKAVASETDTAPKKRGRQPGFSPKAAKAPVAAIAAAPAKSPAKPKGPPAKPDDLTQVKGVGQRVAEALNSEGIYTYKDMAGVSLEQYKDILKQKNMSKFRDPSNWASIAGELAGKK
ncbi:MAG: hypothetical protein K9J37_04070 [Saprospiraceae bacterium]|nr:hypothetical protein [Saprospiraceae bacterium]MCF8249062.1 hypothetical protein [Saprospiraceae bacterium]MCF8280929.1 hypothetical protein [Bacteroidales bacterium]MCF8311084.1 hypothetical protein [Saprospiraceae bacterium]MCF8440174.1 hypothetical protein [Saprospiraceae bacterium]